MKDFFCTRPAEWHPDDVRRQTRVAPALRSAAELRENRQTQYNLHDQKYTQSRKDDIYDLKSTNKPEVCHIQPQFKAPEQIVCCQDYGDHQKLSSSCNKYVLYATLITEKIEIFIKVRQKI